MFFRKKDKQENMTDKLQNFQMKSDFIEKNIFIPTINQQIDAISELFNKIEEIYNELQNENSEYALRYVRDFDSMMIDYYRKEFITNSLNINEQILREAKNEADKARKLLLSGVSSHLKQYMNNLKNLEKNII